MVRRHWQSIGALVLALTVSGPAQNTVNLNFDIGGKPRNAVVYVPSGIQNPPVVYLVHGYGGDGAGFANDTRGNAVADREKFIAIYPSASNKSWNMYDSSDYPFLRALLDSVDRRYRVDRNRVYCAGFSQGGFISNGLGYKHPDLFAAVAPVSGHMPSFSTSTPLRRAIPVLTKFGTNDISDVASFMKDIETWLRLDSCDRTSPKVQRPYPADRPNSAISRTTYTCARGIEVAYDSVIGGGHTWSMDTQRNTNTTEEVWEFFKKYSLPTATGTTRDREFHPQLRARFQGGQLRIEGQDGKTAYVTDLRGERVAQGVVRHGGLGFAGHSRGVYLLRVAGKSGVRTVPITVP